MKKEKSWTRREYEIMYHLMRRGYEFEKIDIPTFISFEVLKAADYSYQAENHNLHGWSSNLRYSRFIQIKWRVYTRRGWFLF